MKPISCVRALWPTKLCRFFRAGRVADVRHAGSSPCGIDKSKRAGRAEQDLCRRRAVWLNCEHCASAEAAAAGQSDFDIGGVVPFKRGTASKGSAANISVYDIYLNWHDEVSFLKLGDSYLVPKRAWYCGLSWRLSNGAPVAITDLE